MTASDGNNTGTAMTFTANTGDIVLNTDTINGYVVRINGNVIPQDTPNIQQVLTAGSAATGLTMELDASTGSGASLFSPADTKMISGDGKITTHYKPDSITWKTTDVAQNTYTITKESGFLGDMYINLIGTGVNFDTGGLVNISGGSGGQFSTNDTHYRKNGIEFNDDTTIQSNGDQLSLSSSGYISLTSYQGASITGSNYISASAGGQINLTAKDSDTTGSAMTFLATSGDINLNTPSGVVNINGDPYRVPTLDTVLELGDTSARNIVLTDGGTGETTFSVDGVISNGNHGALIFRNGGAGGASLRMIDPQSIDMGAENVYIASGYDLILNSGTAVRIDGDCPQIYYPNTNGSATDNITITNTGVITNKNATKTTTIIPDGLRGGVYIDAGNTASTSNYYLFAGNTGVAGYSSPLLFSNLSYIPNSSSLSCNITGNAVTSNNLAGSGSTGGVAGNIPYQSAPFTTGFIANGTSGQVLTSAGTSVPTWSAIPVPTQIFTPDTTGSVNQYAFGGLTNINTDHRLPIERKAEA